MRHDPFWLHLSVRLDCEPVMSSVMVEGPVISTCAALCFVPSGWFGVHLTVRAEPVA